MIPTVAEEYSKLMEHLAKAQETAAMIAHLHANNDPRDRVIRTGWITISEALKLIRHNVTKLAQGRLN